MNSTSNPWELYNQQSMIIQVHLACSWLKQLSVCRHIIYLGIHNISVLILTSITLISKNAL